MGQTNGLEATSSKPIDNAEASLSQGASDSAFQDTISGGGVAYFSTASQETENFTTENFGDLEINIGADESTKLDSLNTKDDASSLMKGQTESTGDMMSHQESVNGGEGGGRPDPNGMHFDKAMSSMSIEETEDSDGGLSVSAGNDAGGMSSESTMDTYLDFSYTKPGSSSDNLTE